jgi:hypothetical protein
MSGLSFGFSLQVNYKYLPPTYFLFSSLFSNHRSPPSDDSDETITMTKKNRKEDKGHENQDDGSKKSLDTKIHNVPSPCWWMLCPPPESKSLFETGTMQLDWIMYFDFYEISTQYCHQQTSTAMRDSKMLLIMSQIKTILQSLYNICSALVDPPRSIRQVRPYVGQSFG